MVAVTKNRYFRDCPLLLYYKSNGTQILTEAAMSSSSYISGLICCHFQCVFFEANLSRFFVCIANGNLAIKMDGLGSH